MACRCMGREIPAKGRQIVRVLPPSVAPGIWPRLRSSRRPHERDGPPSASSCHDDVLTRSTYDSMRRLATPPVSVGCSPRRRSRRTVHGGAAERHASSGPGATRRSISAWCLCFAILAAELLRLARELSWPDDAKYSAWYWLGRLLGVVES